MWLKYSHDGDRKIYNVEKSIPFLFRQADGNSYERILMGGLHHCMVNITAPRIT